MSKSTRKHIRKEKASIRRDFSDIAEQTKLIDELYKRFLKQNDNARNIQPSHK